MRMKFLKILQLKWKMVKFFELWVAARYLFPKKKDGFFSLVTIFSFFGISLGVATLIIVMSVMNGFKEELTSKVLGVNGHIKIQNYNNIKLSNYKELVEIIKKKIPSSNVEPSIISQSLVVSSNSSRGVFLKGLNYENFKDRNIFSENINHKTLIDFKNGEGIIIGKRLHEKLGVKKNDFLKIISPRGLETPFGKINNSKNFKVLDYFETGMYEYDVSLIIVPLNILQNFLGVGDSVDNIEVFVDDFSKFDEYFSIINKTIAKGYSILDWRSLNPSLFNAIEVERNVMFLILLLIIIVAVFNLISSLMMLVHNKKKDIGILRSMGVSKFQLLKIFILNGFTIGLIGTLLGLTLGMMFCININEIKNFIELFIEGELFAKEIYFFSSLPVIINTKQVFFISFFSIFCSLLATIYPAYKASKVDPISLIKWE